MLNKTGKKDTEHWTPLYHAVSEGQIEIVNYLLKNKADVTIKNDQGGNVYHEAAHNGYLQILEGLIIHNIDYVNDVDKLNMTPLYQAVAAGQIEIVNYLLNNKADVTIKADQGWNIYHCAAQEGYLQILEALIRHNSDYINEVQNMNWTPLYSRYPKDRSKL